MTGDSDSSQDYTIAAQVSMCKRCGAQVFWIEAHDDWHKEVSAAVRLAQRFEIEEVAQRTRWLGRP